jgi:hypothetical protein
MQKKHGSTQRAKRTSAGVVSRLVRWANGAHDAIGRFLRWLVLLISAVEAFAFAVAVTLLVMFFAYETTMSVWRLAEAIISVTFGQSDVQAGRGDVPARHPSCGGEDSVPWDVFAVKRATAATGVKQVDRVRAGAERGRSVRGDRHLQ